MSLHKYLNFGSIFHVCSMLQAASSACPAAAHNSSPSTSTRQASVLNPQGETRPGCPGPLAMQRAYCPLSSLQIPMLGQSAGKTHQHNWDWPGRMSFPPNICQQLLWKVLVMNWENRNDQQLRKRTDLKDSGRQGFCWILTESTVSYLPALIRPLFCSDIIFIY